MSAQLTNIEEIGDQQQARPEVVITPVQPGIAERRPIIDPMTEERDYPDPALGPRKWDMTAAR